MVSLTIKYLFFYGSPWFAWIRIAPRMFLVPKTIMRLDSLVAIIGRYRPPSPAYRSFCRRPHLRLLGQQHHAKEERGSGILASRAQGSGVFTSIEFRPRVLKNIYNYVHGDGICIGVVAATLVPLALQMYIVCWKRRFTVHNWTWHFWAKIRRRHLYFVTSKSQWEEYFLLPTH